MLLGLVVYRLVHKRLSASLEYVPIVTQRHDFIHQRLGGFSTPVMREYGRITWVLRVTDHRGVPVFMGHKGFFKTARLGGEDTLTLFLR